jgi:ketosteroid isomerase-like protein
MKKIIFTYVLIIAAMVSFAQSNAEKQVTEAVLAVHKAIFVNKDSLALESLFAPQLTYGHSGGKVENRQETIDNVSQNKSTYTNIEAKVLSVNIQGNTAASRYLLTGTETKPDGKSTELKLNILQVWIKEKKDWKLMARQAVKVS